MGIHRRKKEILLYGIGFLSRLSRSGREFHVPHPYRRVDEMFKNVKRDETQIRFNSNGLSQIPTLFIDLLSRRFGYFSSVLSMT